MALLLRDKFFVSNDISVFSIFYYFLFNILRWFISKFIAKFWDGVSKYVFDFHFDLVFFLTWISIFVKFCFKLKLNRNEFSSMSQNLSLKVTFIVFFYSIFTFRWNFCLKFCLKFIFIHTTLFYWQNKTLLLFFFSLIFSLVQLTSLCLPTTIRGRPLLIATIHWPSSKSLLGFRPFFFLRDVNSFLEWFFEGCPSL